MTCTQEFLYQEKCEKDFDTVMEYLSDSFEELEEPIYNILYIAKHLTDEDFTEDVREHLRSMI